MSGVVKTIGKVLGGIGDVVSAAGKVVKKMWPVLAIAAVTYFTMGAGTAAAGGMSGATVTGGAAGAGLGGAGATGGQIALASTTSGVGAAGAAGAAGAETAALGAQQGPIAGSPLTGGAVEAGTGSVANTTATGGAGMKANIPKYVNTAKSMGPNAAPSEVFKTTSADISTTTGAGQDVARETMASQMTQAGDSFAKGIPGVGGESSVAGAGGGGSSMFESLKTKFGAASKWAEKHPYLTMMGAQTLSNLGQPSEMDLLEKSRQWPGAYYGMEADGTTVRGKQNVQDYAPGTEPNPSILARARNAAETQAPTVNPVDPRVRPANVVQPNINQLNSTRRG